MSTMTDSKTPAATHTARFCDPSCTDGHFTTITGCLVGGEWAVRDNESGSIWWPGDAAAAEIFNSQHPAKTAVEICLAEKAGGRQRGSWQSPGLTSRIDLP